MSLQRKAEHLLREYNNEENNLSVLKILGQCSHKALFQHSPTSLLKATLVSTSWNLKGMPEVALLKCWSRRNQ